MVAVKNWKMTIFQKETTEEIYVSENTFTYKPKYRYGFNGMERDDEMKGIGNSHDFGARLYDPRLGRWFSLDPHSVNYPGLSDYSFVGNMPLIAVDPDGRDIVILEDIVDSGRTLQQLINHFADKNINSFKIATLFY
jgi:RHS repeat-associated protein